MKTASLKKQVYGASFFLVGIIMIIIIIFNNFWNHGLLTDLYEQTQQGFVPMVEGKQWLSSADISYPGSPWTTREVKITVSKQLYTTSQ